MASDDSSSSEHKVPDPPRFVSDQPALVTHCTGCEEPIGLERHIKDIADRYYAVCYDCAPLESGQEPQQQKLVTDGGTEISAEQLDELPILAQDPCLWWWIDGRNNER